MLSIRHGDNRDVLKTLADNSIDSIVTDPPYALVSIVKRFGSPNAAPAKGNEAYARASAGFMGKQWDTGEVAFAIEFWAECLRVLKPGGHVVAFSGTRTYHRMACAIEDAGFEIRDQLQWLYGTGFPKSHDVSKGIDKAAGAEREVVGSYAVPGYAKANVEHGTQSRTKYEFAKTSNVAATNAAREWQGWGTALKPANEPIVLARKPLSEKTVAANVLAHGTGAINVDGCRVAAPGETISNHGETGISQPTSFSLGARSAMQTAGQALGRWPANVLHDGSDEVVGAFPESKLVSRPARSGRIGGLKGDVFGNGNTGFNPDGVGNWPADSGGSAARFFYSAKASKADRAGSKHPTVKPIKLMQWLCRLITPPGGTVLDPFAGSGTTGAAALAEGFNAILIERETEYFEDIKRRFNEGTENGTARTTQETARA